MTGSGLRCESKSLLRNVQKKMPLSLILHERSTCISQKGYTELASAILCILCIEIVDPWKLKSGNISIDVRLQLS
jgi:hypothetical protein